MKNVANTSHTIVGQNNANASHAFPLFSFEALVTYDLILAGYDYKMRSLIPLCQFIVSFESGLFPFKSQIPFF